jgi:hypothetical protein
MSACESAAAERPRESSTSPEVRRCDQLPKVKTYAQVDEIQLKQKFIASLKQSGKNEPNRFFAHAIETPCIS